MRGASAFVSQPPEAHRFALPRPAKRRTAALAKAAFSATLGLAPGSSYPRRRRNILPSAKGPIRSSSTTLISALSPILPNASARSTRCITFRSGSIPKPISRSAAKSANSFGPGTTKAHGLKSPLRNTYDLSRLHRRCLSSSQSACRALCPTRAASMRSARIPPLNAADASRGRVQQGFVEFKQAIGPADVTARIGRQEITLGSGRFVWVNDSSNIRTAHDGVRVSRRFSGRRHARSLRHAGRSTPALRCLLRFGIRIPAHFAAAYASETLLPNQLHVDEYYYFRHNIGAQYAGLTGNEDRDTIGGRLWGAFGSFKYDSDFAYQFGTFDNRPISAFGTSTRVLYTLRPCPGSPGCKCRPAISAAAVDEQSDHRHVQRAFRAADNAQLCRARNARKSDRSLSRSHREPDGCDLALQVRPRGSVARLGQ